MRKNNPVTQFYQIKPGKSGWARIWITDDGCISIMSDYGNYGYWFGDPGCEFRVFLVGCDDAYLGRKLSGGKTEFDGDETVEAIRERILYLRREGRISKEIARIEWISLPTSFDTVDDYVSWATATHSTLQDTYEYGRYVQPHAITQFLKHAWPLFITQLKTELLGEQPLESSGT